MEIILRASIFHAMILKETSSRIAFFFKEKVEKTKEGVNKYCVAFQRGESECVAGTTASTCLLVPGNFRVQRTLPTKFG